MEGAADREEALALVGVVGHVGRAAARDHHLDHARGLRGGVGAVAAHEEVGGSAGGVVGAEERVDGLERAGVEELHRGRTDARGRDGGGRGRRRGGVREERGDRRRDRGRQGPEPYGRAHDDAERALRADHERGEVVARDALHGAVAGVDHAAVGEHDREREDGLAGHAVLGAEQAARVRRDVAADGGDGLARGIR